MSPDPDALARRLEARFAAAGARKVSPDILQPAETLLDLYGEDIRARAYVTADPARGELMLRPDFTLPVAEMHMAQGPGAARYTYSGPVFRRQEAHPDRPSEFLQVGFELFSRDDIADADAEVFARVADAVSPRRLNVVIGDIGLLIAALDGLAMSPARRAALLRHIWRPRRFRALLERFSGRSPAPPSRQALLAAADPFALTAAPHVGKRGRDEIAARIEALRADAAEPPLGGADVARIDAVLSVRGPALRALETLRTIAADLPSLGPRIALFEARLEALAARGVDPAGLGFEASYGRTSMEYYDGFVFGFFAEGRADLPAVATGGRYDALTRRLGEGREIPAVGAVIRPDILAELDGSPTPPNPAETAR